QKLEQLAIEDVRRLEVQNVPGVGHDDQLAAGNGVGQALCKGREIRAVFLAPDDERLGLDVRPVVNDRIGVPSAAGACAPSRAAATLRSASTRREFAPVLRTPASTFPASGNTGARYPTPAGTPGRVSAPSSPYRRRRYCGTDAP